MNSEVWPPAPPVWVMDRPGTSRSTSAKERSLRASMSPAVITVTLLAISATCVGQAGGADHHAFIIQARIVRLRQHWRGQRDQGG